jgi:hypothetical protein
MNRWLAMLLTCLTLALGPGVQAVIAACQPVLPTTAADACGDACCCGDESQCPCVQSTPDRSDLPLAPTRPTTDSRPLLLPIPEATVSVVIEPALRPVIITTRRVAIASSVRSQALLCRWRT